LKINKMDSKGNRSRANMDRDRMINWQWTFSKWEKNEFIL
jgi:hypothetical protein